MMTRLILPIILACVGFCLADFYTVYEWKYIDYVWKSDNLKTNYTTNGVYNCEKIIPNDVQPLPDGRILVTTPRQYANNPATLSTISSHDGDGGSLLEPYPDWSWHTKTDCSGLTDINTVFLSDDNKLWMVDSGKIVNEQVCPPKLLIFNATTDKLLETVPIPLNLSHSPTNTSKGRLEIAAVESDSTNTHAYIADSEGNGVVIWNGKAMWRLNDPIYAPNTTETTFEIAGENISLPVGPKGQMIVLKSEWVKTPALLFKPLAADRPFSCSLKDFHNSRNSTPTYYQSQFIEPSQETARTFTRKNQIFIGAFAGSMAACWNSNNTLALANIGILSTNATTLQYVSSIKSILSSSGKSETVYVMSNRLQKFLLNSMNFTEVNYRIMTGDVDTLIKGTVCEPSGSVAQVATIKDKLFDVYSGSS